MINLGSLEEISKLDPQNTLESTNLLAKQCLTAWKEINKINVPSDYKNISNIICCGMGASIYGALVAKALAGSKLSYPFEFVTDYHLPEYANEKTLVILTSYSGTTEEVLSCAEEALQKQAKILVLSKGGPLAEIAKANHIPSYIFDGKLNPAGIPRLGNGYSVVGLLGLLQKAGIIDFDTNLFEKTLYAFLLSQKTIKNEALNEVDKFINKIPIIISAEHLSGNAQILRNQFNETSKTFSAFYLVPDLNHHLMEGLKFPDDNKLFFVILNSNHYSDKIKKRMQLTKDVISKNNCQIFEYLPESKNIYEDFLKTMVFGSFITLFLGLYYKQNPATNPWVDYFKAELKK